MVEVFGQLKGGLILSCQAPVDSPLHAPLVIRAMAQAGANNGAVGVRLDTPEHVQAVKPFLKVPVIGLWKVVTPGSAVYITPGLREVAALKAAGADIIATDATQRSRPDGVTLAQVIAACHEPPFCPVLADISSLEEAETAIQLGADAVATTLFGYTAATEAFAPPGWELLAQLIAKSSVPVLLEGGVQTPNDVRRALEMGAWAVVVGGALTGLDARIRQFCP